MSVPGVQAISYTRETSPVCCYPQPPLPQCQAHSQPKGMSFPTPSYPANRVLQLFPASRVGNTDFLPSLSGHIPTYDKNLQQQISTLSENVFMSCRLAPHQLILPPSPFHWFYLNNEKAHCVAFPKLMNNLPEKVNLNLRLYGNRNISCQLYPFFQMNFHPLIFHKI